MGVFDINGRNIRSNVKGNTPTKANLPALALPTAQVSDIRTDRAAPTSAFSTSGLAENANQLYSSGYSGGSDPYNTFKDFGFTPSTAGTMGGTGSQAYSPGMHISDGTYPNADTSLANTQYTNLAGDGTVGLTPNTPSGGWNVTGSGIAEGVKAATGLANAYLGYKNYGLAKDMFGFQKAATNRSVANQASEYNTGVQNAGEVGMSLAGNSMSANDRAARQAQLDSQKISGSAIG